MTREDYWYLPPEPAPDPRCVHTVDGEECGEPTDGGPVCDEHPAETPEQYDAYAAKAA
ncbi:hypothetical protein [Nocardiopsis synnemataformans]|uniref:hypothetical protein n=1 Tax=Nocardiopsis synnemataformans TaxID=61305 RepID=UPI003EB9D734